MTDAVSVIFALHFVAVATPGPDFAVVTQRAMAHGRRAGIAAGLIAHVTFALLGLGAVLHAFPALGRALALAGAGYLGWLVSGCLRSRSGDTGAAPAGRGSRGDFAAGLLTNLLNPKVVLYFAGLFSQIDPHGWTPVRMLAVGGGIVAITFAWFAFVASAFSSAPVLKTIGRRRVVFDRALGIVPAMFAFAPAMRAALIRGCARAPVSGATGRDRRVCRRRR